MKANPMKPGPDDRDTTSKAAGRSRRAVDDGTPLTPLSFAAMWSAGEARAAERRLAAAQEGPGVLVWISGLGIFLGLALILAWLIFSVPRLLL